METVLLADIATAVSKASDVLCRDGVILYPTDTLYGLGADALSDTSVDKVYAIKGREPGKPMHCVVADLAMAAEYAEVGEAAQKIAERFLPGPLTLILKKLPGVETGIARGINTFGIRIPDTDFCRELARAFGKPITTPSANPAGMEPQLSVEKIIAQFGEAADGIELAIDAGEARRTAPSTVLDVSSGEPKILREGAIPAADILALF